MGGGVCNMGRTVLILGKLAKKGTDLDDLKTVVSHIRTTMGILLEIELDTDLHHLNMAEFIYTHVQKGLEVIVPRFITIQKLSDAQFHAYRTLLSGITTENRNLIR